MSSFLKQVVGELGKKMNMKLDLNQFNTAVMKLSYGIEAGIESDQDQKNIIISAVVGIVPHGSYREEFFERALQSNALPPPNIGKFGWAEKGDYFIIFETFPVKRYNPQQAYEVLEPLALKAKVWRDALKGAVLPLVEQQIKKDAKGPMGLFGKLKL